MEVVPTSKFVVLLRVSTAKQGAEGLGIDAQKRDINLFRKQQENPEVVSELVEVESGAATERKVLEQALTLCRKHKATLLVQKVDRITRDLDRLAHSECVNRSQWVRRRIREEKLKLQEQEALLAGQGIGWGQK